MTLPLLCRSFGSNKFVKRKCPRWFAHIVSSSPSLFSRLVPIIIPALLINPWRGKFKSSNSFTNCRTESKSDTSHSRKINLFLGDEPAVLLDAASSSTPGLISSEKRISSIALLALISDLHAITTVPPAKSNCRAVSLPIPVFDPVQINTFFMALLTTAAFGFGPVTQFFRVRIISTQERQHENSKDGRKAIKKDDPSVSLHSASKTKT
mmetsp:Transcript_3018/g.4448  ORF Transcript_3018/g.4448 Transcript_3018/m.4448 type:complete len:209 (-) Transcript_3018:473-1099(-)